jgi:hypothetical protein
MYRLYVNPSFHAGEPKGVNLILPECFEDNEISPIKTYFGGMEGTGKYKWFRSEERPHTLEFDLVAASSEVVGETLFVLSLTVSKFLVLGNPYNELICCKSIFFNRKYKVSLDDVGSYLVLYWVPTRCDGKTGNPVMAITDDPVMAGCPLIFGIFVCSFIASRSLLFSLYLQLFHLFWMFIWSRKVQMCIVGWVSIMVDMRDQACTGGTGNLLMEPGLV